MRIVVLLSVVVAVGAVSGLRALPPAGAAPDPCQERCRILHTLAGEVEFESPAQSGAGEAAAGEVVGPGMDCFLCGVEDLLGQISVVGVGLPFEPALDLALFDPAGRAP